MKQEKFNSLMVAIVAIAAVFGFVSIVWASFSSTLTISNFNATVQHSKWEVKFGTVQAPTIVGTATGTAPTANADSTVLSGFTVSLKTPGDEVSFVVPVENHGTYKAKVTALTLPTVDVANMTSDAASASVQAADIEKIQDKVEVELTYADGTAINVGDEIAAAVDTTPGSKLVKVTVRLKDMEASDLPIGNVTVPITASSIVYGQA